MKIKVTEEGGVRWDKSSIDIRPNRQKDKRIKDYISEAIFFCPFRSFVR